MSTSYLIRLDQFEQVPERRFANPEHSMADIAILEYMCARLLGTLRAANIRADDPLNRELYIQAVPEDGERLHRMVILARQPLLSAGELIVVGFFGQKRGDANPAILQDVDTELLQEFLSHTHVLSYSSLELPDGNWANLVLMGHADGIEHWRASQKHAYAARDLAPQFYQTIRLHNATLPSGLTSPKLSLIRTKYYDYGNARWQAIREFRSIV